MKKIFFLITVLTITISQGFSQVYQGYIPKEGSITLNGGFGASNWGIPIYVSGEYGFPNWITGGAKLSYSTYSEQYAGTDYKYNVVSFLAFANYHYGGHLAIVDYVDLYGGASLGVASWDPRFSSSDVNYSKRNSSIILALQGGARYYFDKNLAAHGEISIGNLIGMTLGVSYTF